MKYPTGDKIEIGDHIWINGGTQSAIVVDIVDSNEQFKRWGLDETGIFVSTNLITPTADVFISEIFFEEEGIDRIS